MADVPQLNQICCKPQVRARCLQRLDAKASYTGLTSPVFMASAWLHQAWSDGVECKSQSRVGLDHMEMVALEMQKGRAGAQ